MPAFAQSEDPLRVLVLHGIWNEREWDQNFDAEFSQALSQRLTPAPLISFQDLAIGAGASTQTIEFYRQTVDGIVNTVGVDLIVAVLPEAIDFVKDLESYMSVPIVATLPAKPNEYLELPPEKFRVVESTAPDAIRNTLLAATKINPNATQIEVLSGPEIWGTNFKELVQSVVEQDFANYKFITHYDKPLPDLETTLSNLSESSIALTLPFFSVDPDQLVSSESILTKLSAVSTQPLYGFSEPFFGKGIAGGYVFTAQEYANASADAVISLINGGSYDSKVSGEFSSLIFDYEEVRRFQLALDRLDEPYVVLNEPRSFLQYYRNTVFAVGVVFLLLCLALYQLFKALMNSELAKAQLQISEREARDSQVKYELLTKNTLDVIWTWDQEKLQTTYCSPSIEQLSGYTANEFMSLGMRDVMTESSARNALALVFSPTRSSGMFEIELIRKDGSKIWCEIAAQPIVEEGKVIHQWVGITRDISKRKQEESDRLALEGQLRQAQKFESLGTLAGGIAHDFNNMLGVMIGLNELLKLKVADSPAAVDIIDKLMSTADRAKGLVGQILAFSRQSNLHKVDFNLGELAADALQLIQSGMPKSVSFEQHLGVSPIHVHADSNQVSQVFVIILTNAYEALEQQQGEIDFSIGEIELATNRECLHGHLEPGPYAKITVTDSGLGVSAERIDSIFDPFYTSKDLGSGMGLSIARGIVLAHGGGIDFSSTPFEGSTISVYLPAVKKESAVLPSSNKPTASGRSTILLIDDQKDLLETIGMMLEVLGHDCIQCSDPREAMTIISDDKVDIDLVITDYSMPDVTGLDIADLCAEKRPSVPVILATGYNESTAYSGTTNIQERLVLSKPFGINELETMLDGVLSGETN